MFRRLESGPSVPEAATITLNWEEYRQEPSPSPPPPPFHHSLPYPGPPKNQQVNNKTEKKNKREKDPKKGEKPNI